MKKILLVLFLAMLSQSLRAQNAEGGSFFVKAGGGFVYPELTFTNYSHPIGNGLSDEIDTSELQIKDLTGSFSAGYDFPGSFSLFGSSEWYPHDWAVLANAQYTFPAVGLVDPYFFVGIGMDFNDMNSFTESNQGVPIPFTVQTIGPAFQLALGADTQLVPHLVAFLEARVFTALTLNSNNDISTEDYYRIDLYIPLLAGLKSNF